jgi:hypothetical protein
VVEKGEQSKVVSGVPSPETGRQRGGGMMALKTGGKWTSVC